MNDSIKHVLMIVVVTAVVVYVVNNVSVVSNVVPAPQP